MKRRLQLKQQQQQQKNQRVILNVGDEPKYDAHLKEVYKSKVKGTPHILLDDGHYVIVEAPLEDTILSVFYEENPSCYDGVQTKKVLLATNEEDAIAAYPFEDPDRDGPHLNNLLELADALWREIQPLLSSNKTAS